MPIKISAKNLGALALPGACPRCFWLKHQLDKPPFSIFPGIFFTIDSYVKRVTNVHFAAHGKLPSWIEEFCGQPGTPIAAPKRGTFQMPHPSGLLITGIPDELIKLADGTIAIPDYKTAKVTDKQDSLLGMYETQLNGYAQIAEHLGLGAVTRIGLIYYEPIADLDPAILAQVQLPDGFNLKFRYHGKVMPREDARFNGLAKRAREILEQPTPPRGNVDCDDCARVDKLVKLATAPTA